VPPEETLDNNDESTMQSQLADIESSLKKINITNNVSNYNDELNYSYRVNTDSIENKEKNKSNTLEAIGKETQ
jgi:hypothetical protein